MDFSNREISSCFWLIAILGWAMRAESVRSSALSLVTTFFQWKVITLFTVAGLYISSCVSLLAQWGIWTNDNLKTTITWAVGFVFSTTFLLSRNKGTEHLFSKIARDIFTISAILTFISELHSFNIIIELFLVPSLASASILHAYTSTNQDDKRVYGALSHILAIFGAFFILRSMYLSFADIDKFASLATLREFFIPIILSLSFLPLLNLIDALFAYEQAYGMIKFTVKDGKLARATMLRALFTFMHHRNALLCFAQSIARFHPQAKTELDHLFAEAMAMAKREANPPVIDESRGWSPYAAMEFLTNEGLRTRRYTRIVNDEWSASSNYLETDNSLLSNKLSYYLSGTALAATELKLMLDVSNPSDSISAETQFVRVSSVLLEFALGAREAGLIMRRVEQLEEFEQQYSRGTVHLVHSLWSGGMDGGYSLKLLIRHINHRQS